MSSTSKPTRILLELRVGRTHSVNVLLHLRRADVDWFHSSTDEYKQELFRLLSKDIIPREFEQEIEEYHDRRSSGRSRATTTVAVEVGEKNKKKSKRGGRKRKRALEQSVESREKSQREIRHVFGESMQLTYRAQETKQNEGATLLFPTKKSNESSSKATRFRQLNKLSKRIIVWCYPRDSENPDDSPPKGGGFLRPEMVPISSLFRPPPAAAADSDA